MKQLILKAAKACGLFALSRRLTRGQLRILCYHGIWIGGEPHFGDCLFMRAHTFARRMARLAEAGYPVLGLQDGLARLADGTLPDGAVVITIDDAWNGIVEHMLPVLRERGFPATLYVTTYYTLAQRPVINVLMNVLVSRAAHVPPLADLLARVDEGAGAGDGAQAVAPAEVSAVSEPAEALSRRIDALPTLALRWQAVERVAQALGADLDRVLRERWLHLMSPEQLRAAQAEGIDLQLHTHTHRMHDFAADAVMAEVQRNRRELADILNVAEDTLTHFCYPSGVYDPSVFPVLASCGVRSATTTDFGLNARGANPFALKRILDCESMSDLDLEARLCGFWSLLGAARRALARGK